MYIYTSLFLSRPEKLSEEKTHLKETLFVNKFLGSTTKDSHAQNKKKTLSVSMKDDFKQSKKGPLFGCFDEQLQCSTFSEKEYSMHSMLKMP